MGDRARCTIIVGIGITNDNQKVLDIFKDDDEITFNNIKIQLFRVCGEAVAIGVEAFFSDWDDVVPIFPDELVSKLQTAYPIVYQWLKSHDLPIENIGLKVVCDFA